MDKYLYAYVLYIWVYIIYICAYSIVLPMYQKKANAKVNTKNITIEVPVVAQCVRSPTNIHEDVG